MRNPLPLLLTGLLLSYSILSPANEANTNTDQYRTWIAEMKTAERGPFSRIRWFCNDGTELPPTPYACKNHGGGKQHGEWNQKTLELRRNGYLVANILAGMDAKAFVESERFYDAYAQILIERFLISADDGWILRRALFYRGAIQEEVERREARNLLMEMASRPKWAGPGFSTLRTGARMLPHGPNSASIQNVRQVSATLSNKDSGFKSLRAKIHGAPDAEDAQRVRKYAQQIDASQQQAYLDLADEIDSIYRAAPLAGELMAMAGRYTAAPWLQALLTTAANSFGQGATARQRFTASSSLLSDLRANLSRIRSTSVRLDILDLSLRLESENFRAASELRPGLDSLTRRQMAIYLKSAAQAAYGTGVINARLLEELGHSLDSLDVSSVQLNQYLRTINYLGRAPGWGTQALRMHFYESMEKLAEIEPMSMLFIQDQLRGSPLLFYSTVLDKMSRDANQLAGVKHRFFGEVRGTGLTALNPGLAQGTLHVKPNLIEMEDFATDGIYVLPETVAELPPIAGILTAGEGNPLSHIQLLARNLGIPNVTVSNALIQELAGHDGEHVVLAVSTLGLVEMSPWSQAWEDIFDNARAGGNIIIKPDLKKLDLTVRDIVSLDDLRAQDSGRTVGPKAAKLGELRARYPGHVSRGLAIPFGIFREEIFERPYPNGGGSVFEWMVKNYQELASIREEKQQYVAKTEAFRAELYDIIVQTKISPAFEQKLRTAMKDVFGAESPPGIFVRSDTNVEDLEGFTGAGLNLTLPNVVGIENLLQAIARVWASPFTARAFAWRQSHMSQPEHVYTSILLLESVASDKSGVLVTRDIDSGNAQVISVAVNEGLGGAVDGQAAESLRIALDGSFVHVLATATAPWRRLPDPHGGLQYLHASGADVVLQPAEIDQLIEFSQHLPEKFPSIVDDQGNPAPADVEFGFVDGDLRLFQLRPFLDNKMVKSIGYLHQMEAGLKNTDTIRVNMNGVAGS